MVQMAKATIVGAALTKIGCQRARNYYPVELGRRDRGRSIYIQHQGKYGGEGMSAIIQRNREGKLDHAERCDLVGAAKSALRRAGTQHTTFIWRGVLLHYGLTDHGAYAIAEGPNSDESEWRMETRDPFTNAVPFAEYGNDVTQMSDEELMRRMAWDDREENPWRDEVRRRYPHGPK
jgi:hypothetical protein